MTLMSVCGRKPATRDFLGHYLDAAGQRTLRTPKKSIELWVTVMTNPGDFREALLALIALGGSAFTVEQYIRFRAWPRSEPEGTAPEAQNV
ncbi:MULTISPECIES: hypothetical protein [Methylobacterium]|uniref:hypothetical protein n=1 Tax=Methylobacterium TaxID=407 RepID=UPI0013EB740E|nr:hypothetical protein [Methylobacterium sp. DB0501]NGM36215.1 hypothetical protein [Methylobacterium sp. DB0501]